ncbi:interferon-induced protein 44-like isoform X2 [Mizuhopecten yessoensis]|uniref:interferon-induced protein 44-like isoform X2 n=1 Tax=Mizuhopecten yessoensis TaxID=6573 RepID=UPI000B45F390|nr:interferon-induced protein 44-like isoform X2 [Mizuhopecten yessoensis]
MATELTQTHKDQLSKWIDSTKNYKFTLLYKISRDGCVAPTFHSLCDNKGPTVTVLYNTDKSVYGAYTAVNWQSNGAYSVDAKAFLFKLEYNGTAQPMKFPNKTGGTNAIYGNASYGPTFGGHDLHSFSATVNKSGNNFPLNGNTNGFGGTYDMQGQNYNSVMNGHLQVLDLEVYSIEEQELLQKPWIRNVDWSRKFEEEIKDRVATYKPLPGLDLQQARILLVGQVGAGKSSYFNTINSIFRGHISAQANAGSAEHSLTTSYRTYQVRDGYAGKSLNFRLCDTRGLEEDQGLDDHEIGYLLEGHVPDRYKFNPAVPLSPEAIGFVKNPKLSDRIQCVVFVLDGSAVDVIPAKVMERIKAMQIRMNQRGIPQVVLLTKIDRICEEISNDISKVFFSPRMKDCVDRVSMVMGLPRSHILPVKNYESEVELDQNINILSLLSLRRILNFADDYLYNTLDEIELDKVQHIKIRERN